MMTFPDCTLCGDSGEITYPWGLESAGLVTKVVCDCPAGAKLLEFAPKPVATETFVKHDQDKSRVELISPHAILAIGRVLALGAKKYSADNWRNGAEWRRYIGAALRHVFSFASGENNDPETGESHLVHAMCCLLFLFEYVRCNLGTDDRWKETTK